MTPDCAGFGSVYKAHPPVHMLTGSRRLREVDYYRDDPLVLHILGLRKIPDVSTISRALSKVEIGGRDLPGWERRRTNRPTTFMLMTKFQDLPRIDESLFFELFSPTGSKPPRNNHPKK
jgi:hypothetical protein